MCAVLESGARVCKEGALCRSPAQVAGRSPVLQTARPAGEDVSREDAGRARQEDGHRRGEASSLRGDLQQLPARVERVLQRVLERRSQLGALEEALRDVARRHQHGELRARHRRQTRTEPPARLRSRTHRRTGAHRLRRLLRTGLAAAHS